jgi:dipeptidyl aminopeptidase/acylaminoacyl peptidase
MLATDSEPRLITAHAGNVSHSVYDFTRDSAKLVYSTDEHGEFIQAWTYDVGTGAKAPLIAADWDVMFVSFSETGRYRVSATNEDARTVVQILDNGSGREIALPGLPAGDLAQIRFSRDESKVALMVSSDTSPSDVYTVDLASGRSARLTEALNPEIDEADLVATEVVRYKSFDELDIPSILYRPQGATATHKVPALVWVHGGPGGQSRTGYSPTIQHLVNHGYAVLAANNRGSSGYGKTFFHMDDRRHGDVDLKDIVNAKNYLASLDWVDSEKIGIIGGSYGGYMVGAAPYAEAAGADGGGRQAFSLAPGHACDVQVCPRHVLVDPRTYEVGTEPGACAGPGTGTGAVSQVCNRRLQPQLRATITCRVVAGAIQRICRDADRGTGARQRGRQNRHRT